MTNDDLTRSLIYLDSFDMDGLIDIARYGFNPTTNVTTKNLVQRLANAIVAHVSPHYEDVIRATDCSWTALDEDDESLPQLSIQAALAVFPLKPMMQLNVMEVSHENH